MERADDGIRTRDLRFTKPLLYQLSYVGARAGKDCIARRMRQENMVACFCMNRLEEILRVKRAEIERLRPRAAELYRKAQARKEFRSFRQALAPVRHHKRLTMQPSLRVIAEIKKASPSAGVIAESFDPAAVARNYERTGASAISVLTDEKFFQGALAHLIELRKVVSLPVLRKDFILDEIQIVESVAAGADAILLIVATLNQKQLGDFYQAAASYQLDALVEVHTSAELDRALSVGAKIIGINNRNLTTFTVDLSVTEKLSARIPKGILRVSESGIKSAEDVARVKACGVDAILVGEALMRGQLSLESL
jgi:indole-3-glycerol phosphate synthase